MFALRSLKQDSALFVDDLISWNAAEDQVGFDQDKDAESLVDTAPVTVEPLTVLDAERVPGVLLPRVGSRPWARSPIDERILNTVEDGTGQVIDHEDDVGGIGSIENTVRALEIPDDPAGDDDGDGDGFTNLEAWLRTFEG